MRNFADNMTDLKESYAKFKEWQRRPYQVKPLVDEEHDCATCGTHFRGNYCPRCGQSAVVGRYSFKKAFLLFLDVWGLGNRSMFRTVRDLLLRPGYMIRDYLRGMQMAYFPPFKMFFLVIALSVLVDTGFNLKGENRLKKATDMIAMEFDDDHSEDMAAAITDSVKQATKSILSARHATTEGLNTLPVDSAKLAAQTDSTEDAGEDINEDAGEADSEKASPENPFSKSRKNETIRAIVNWIMSHQTLVMFIWLLVLSVPLYLFFRHSPAFPDIRFSEFFVAMVYTTNMMNIVSVIGGILCLNVYGWEPVCYALSIFPLMQLSGYSFWRTLWKVVCAFTLLMLAIIIIAFIVGVIAMLVSIMFFGAAK